CPQIRVVASRVAASEDVLEIGGAVARGDGVDIHARSVERRLFKVGDSFRGGLELGCFLRRQRVPCEVNDGCCDVFGGGEALAKLGGLGGGIEKLVGDDLSGVHVARVVCHQRRIECPVFVDLRG